MNCRILIGAEERGTELTESRAVSGTNADWKIPQPHDAAPVHLADGGLIVLRRYGNPDGPRLVLSHGSGLSVDAYFPFWSLLLPRFDLIGYDLRNHGRNPLGDLAAHHMPMMVWDNLRVVRAIDRHFGPKPKIGVYHSVSAAIAVFQAVEESSFTALVLFDPPVCPPGLPVARQESIRALAARMAARARARQNHFERWEDLAESLRRARPFERVDAGAVDLLARATLRRRIGEEGFELCCPPDYEANLFEQLYKWAIAIDLGSLDCAIKVIGGDPLAQFSFLPSVERDLIQRVDYDFIPESTHLLQLEEPEVCVELMCEFLVTANLA